MTRACRTAGHIVLLVLALAGCDRPAAVPRAQPVTTVDHEKVFPLSTGEHHKNIECDACHGQFDTFTRFDCSGCHPQAAVDPMHLEKAVPDYVYESAACYECHPTGDCHPKEDCATHPEDCLHLDGDMAGTTAPSDASAPTDPAMEDPMDAAGGGAPLDPAAARTTDVTNGTASFAETSPGAP